MLILLPPSESKRCGGRARPLDTAALALPSLAPQRERVLDALAALSADPGAAARVLRLGRTQLHEIPVNAAVREGPTLPAVDRYTGVLYDALDAGSLGAAARRWLGRHALIHSAPLGPVGALDPIPAYRLGAATALPGLPAPRRVWAEAVAAALTAASPSFVLDLRSDAYVALGPVPAAVPSALVRVVTAAPDGSVRALNHFNKRAKGALVRELAVTRPRITSSGALLRWAATRGMDVRAAGAGLELVV